MRQFFRYLRTIACCLIATACYGVMAQTVQSKFDVPALIEAHAVTNEAWLDPNDDYEKLIEIVVPVSCWVEKRYRDDIQEFRFDVLWHGNHHPVVDYRPRTSLQSPVHGTIAIEKRDDQTFRLGGDTIVPTAVTNVAARMEKAMVSGQITRFEEIPQHDLLIASGSVNRGTGAFFRFHSSKQFPLEGGRDLTLICRVPKTWRAGLLRVDCLGLGKVKRFANFTEEIRSSISFLVPIYLKGDREAQRAAIEYVQQEQSLRQSWSQYLADRSPTTVLESMQKNLVWRRDEPEPPADLAQRVIHADDEIDLEPTTNKLPSDLRNKFRHFALARRQMIALGY